MESGHPDRPRRQWHRRWQRHPLLLPALVAAAGLVAGLVIGYQAGPGSHPAGRANGSGASVVAPAAASFGVVQSGSECSAQEGDRLELGVEITNLASEAVWLRRVRAVLPLGGLQVTATTWGPCGQLNTGADDISPNILAGGASTWFTITVRVQGRCPGALPVQFELTYEQNDRRVSAELPGFVDLGQVPYTGCNT